MRNRAILLILSITLILTTFTKASETGHYVLGVEGLKGASVPPAGYYYRMYNVWYSADKLMDGNGDKINNDFDLDILATVQRLIWITDKKIFGADYGMSAIVPIQYADIKIGAANISESTTGIGDLFLEPLILAWHEPQYDLALGYSMYIPTAQFDSKDPSSIGKDFWTHMLTFGGTYFFDTERTWNLSVLGRYEMHTQKDNTNITAGDDLHFEWGFGKTFQKTIDVGITGYCHWQVTDDEGSDVTWDRSTHDKVYSVGPEISMFLPKQKLAVSLRSQWEFDAVDRPQGQVTVLTLTKPF